MPTMILSAAMMREAQALIERGDMAYLTDDVLKALRAKHAAVADAATWIPEYILARRHALEMVSKIDDVLRSRKPQNRCKHYSWESPREGEPRRCMQCRKTLTPEEVQSRLEPARNKASAQ